MHLTIIFTYYFVQYAYLFMHSNNDTHLLLHGLLKLGMIMNKSSNKLSEGAKPMSWWFHHEARNGVYQLFKSSILGNELALLKDLYNIFHFLRYSFRCSKITLPSVSSQTNSYVQNHRSNPTKSYKGMFDG